METNHKYGLIAIAEYGLSPSIFVYSYPSKQLKYTFQGSFELNYLNRILGASQLEIQDLKISRDGKKLISIAGVPDYEIRIWNLENGELYIYYADQILIFF